jgi:hypothetical protein
VIEQANGISDLLQRQPLAGFLALTLVALAMLFVLLLREKAAHQATLREVVTLTSAISAQWTRQLDVQEKLSTVLEQLLDRDRARARRSQENPRSQ